MIEKTITLTRNELFNLFLRYENEVTCAKELPVFLDRVMNGDDEDRVNVPVYNEEGYSNEETANIDYDAHGKAGDRIALVTDGLFRCRMCGDFFHSHEVWEIHEFHNGMTFISHICKRCDGAEHNYTDPKEGE